MSLALALLLAAPAPEVAGLPGRAADAVFDRARMDRARALLRREHGGMAFSMLTVDLFEVQARKDRDGYRFEGQGWWGGDLDRLSVKLRAEGDFGRAADETEAELLYVHAIGPWFNLEAGVRQDAEPRGRTYAAIGFQGLASYMIEASGTVFLSPGGTLLGRLEVSHDLRITQHWILTPRVEINLAAQDVPARRWGAGLAEAELGMRLHYAIVPRIAPYVGIEWQRSTGRSARLVRAVGDEPGRASFVSGIRIWF